MNISVIIPVYKTEEYLEECVNSILAQATQDVEVILVDDGSPDNCPQICDELMRTDSRVKVIHKTNGGLSSARNAGMSVAIGKYITFVDSDDKIFSCSIPDILLWIESEDTDIDMCFLQAIKLYPDGTQEDLGEGIIRSQLKTPNREDAIRHLASRSKYPGSAWAKLYRRAFLVENKLEFPHDNRYSEDLGFIRDCIMCANTFDVLPMPFYQYRQKRQGSITNNISIKNFNDLLLFITESVQKIDTQQCIGKSVMSFVAYEYTVLLYVFSRLSKQEKKQCLKQLKTYAYVLRYAGTKQGCLLHVFCRIFGVKITSFFLKCYKEVIRK